MEDTLLLGWEFSMDNFLSALPFAIGTSRYILEFYNSLLTFMNSFFNEGL